MTRLSKLGITSTIVSAAFLLATQQDIKVWGATVAWIAAILFGFHALAILIRAFRMAALESQMLRDPDLGEKAVEELGEDTERWAKAEFNRFTNVVFVVTMIFAIAVWVPVWTA